MIFFFDVCIEFAATIENLVRYFPARAGVRLRQGLGSLVSNVCTRWGVWYHLSCYNFPELEVYWSLSPLYFWWYGKPTAISRFPLASGVRHATSVVRCAASRKKSVVERLQDAIGEEEQDPDDEVPLVLTKDQQFQYDSTVDAPRGIWGEYTPNELVTFSQDPNATCRQNMEVYVEAEIEKCFDFLDDWKSLTHCFDLIDTVCTLRSAWAVSMHAECNKNLYILSWRNLNHVSVHAATREQSTALSKTCGVCTCADVSLPPGESRCSLKHAVELSCFEIIYVYIGCYWSTAGVRNVLSPVLCNPPFKLWIACSTGSTMNYW